MFHRCKTTTMEQRFLSKINKIEDGCWEWNAFKNNDGYGKIRVAGKTLARHRVAYELWKGEIPDGMCILHSCDNPPCCNPAHLSIGTRDENNKQRKERGRGRTNPHRGEACNSSKLTEQQVLEIRAINNMSQSAIARMYGITQSNVFNIVSRKSWSHI